VVLILIIIIILILIPILTLKAAAIATAVASADMVVIGVGGIFGAEARDRTNISLPDVQINTVRQVVAQATHGNVVMVLVNGDSISLDGIKARYSSLSISQYPLALRSH
jgi:ABC-type enterochelin transport system substrate-binding protein